ncbi:hypothetical protein DV738_g4471, partial [Chaetothyriales sp. CBS 135597]
MAPSTPHIASQLRHLIYYQLDNGFLSNALFLAQQLVAYEPRSADAAYLLAECQFQAGFLKQAYETSRPFGLRGLHLGCAYVFAQACLQLGRCVDGLTALDKSKAAWQARNSWNQHTESRRQHLPDAAAVLCLKGKLWKHHKNADQAVECWAAALRLNPFMWDAFTGLTDAGARTTNHINQNADPFACSTASSRGPHGSGVLWERLNGSKANVAMSVLDEEAISTPSGGVAEPDPRQPAPFGQPNEPPPAPVRKARTATALPTDAPPRFTATRPRLRAKAGEEASAILPDAAAPAAPTKRTVSGQPAHTASQVNGVEGTRRSNRLLNSHPPAASSAGTSKLQSFTNTLGLREGREIKKPRAPTKARTATLSTVGRVVSGNRKRIGSADTVEADGKETRKDSVPGPSVPPLVNAKVRTESAVSKEIAALQTLLDIEARLAAAQLSLSQFDCQAALQTYNSLPTALRETPYVLAQMGKACYEQASYADAEKYFVRVRQLAPSRLQDMEVYSTVLWHLKSEVELAYLARELIEIDRLSPQAWCAVGNSFSLHRQHEQALRCFKRATQLDPDFAYAFTLQGHEHVANEEFEKALDAYRCAIAAEGRHYNAWYGLGKVYEKMGKWQIAETHFATAAQINPNNAVLVCCMGVVVEKLRDPVRALDLYTRACALSPNSALTRFKKAKCLMALHRPREALEELKVLRDLVPEEANVWFMMGRLYKMTRQKAEAVRAFTMALNLDPKTNAAQGPSAQAVFLGLQLTS